MTREFSNETKCVQSGYNPNNGDPRIAPLVQSTTYKYDTADELGDLFDLKAAGHIYSRISNPTVSVLEDKITDLEGGVGAMGTSSGQSATLLSILTITQAGDNIISLANIYGGSVNLLTFTLKKFGIETRFIKGNPSKEELEKLIDDKTRAIFSESLSNPGTEVLDIERIAGIAHDNGIPLIVDNTLATPYLCRPFEHGADIVVHSTSKYLDGHATSVGGLVVDSGNFDWNNGKFEDMTKPDVSYHGLSFTEAFGKAAYIFKARCAYVRDVGFIMAPFNAFLTNLGTETLALRMERHSENALRIAKYLESSDKVAWVNYPGLESNPSYELAKKYLPKGSSGVISFGIKGDDEAGKRFIDNLELIKLVTHVADVRSCILHPASTTHRQLSDEQLQEVGVSKDLLRLSVGIENVDDLILDIENALNIAIK